MSVQNPEICGHRRIGPRHLRRPEVGHQMLCRPEDAVFFVTRTWSKEVWTLRNSQSLSHESKGRPRPSSASEIAEAWNTGKLWQITQLKLYENRCNRVGELLKSKCNFFPDLRIGGEQCCSTGAVHVGGYDMERFWLPRSSVVLQKLEEPVHTLVWSPFVDLRIWETRSSKNGWYQVVLCYSCEIRETNTRRRKLARLGRGPTP